MNFKGFYYLYLKETRRFLIVWGQTLLGPMITSLLFLFVFVVAFKGGSNLNYLPTEVSFIDFLVPGLIMMQVTQNAFGNTSSSILMSKVFGTINDVLSAPLNSKEIALAYILSSTTRGVVTALIILVTCYLATINVASITIVNFLAAIYFLITASFILGAVGLICGLWAVNFDRMSTLTNLVIMPLSFLSGTFYSITSLPNFVQKIICFNPVFYMIDGFRYAFTGVSDFNVAIEAIVLFILAIVLYVVCVILIKFGYNTKS